MERKVKDTLKMVLMTTVDVAMMSGNITGVEIVEALEATLKSVKGANEAVLHAAASIGGDSEAMAMRVIYGEPEGSVGKHDA